MSRKHFQAIAASLANSKPCILAPVGHKDRVKQMRHLEQWRIDVLAMVAVCRQFNSNFNKDRFLGACNYEN